VSSIRECGVCWTPYDPALGDPVWQIEAGTPFDALPEHWRCPKCDSPRDRFLPPSEDLEPAAGIPIDERLREAYESTVPRMRELPIFNAALRVEAVGFRDFEGGQIGMVITPWFMNLVFVPGSEASGPCGLGEARRHSLPAGACDFIGARLEGVGPIEACSLFSPMDEFPNAEAAHETARQALERLFTPPAAPEALSPAVTSRRELFARILGR